MSTQRQHSDDITFGPRVTAELRVLAGLGLPVPCLGPNKTTLFPPLYFTGATHARSLFVGRHSVQRYDNNHRLRCIISSTINSVLENMYLDQDFVGELLAKTSTLPLPVPTSTVTPTPLPTIIPTHPTIQYEVAHDAGKRTLWLVHESV